MIAVADARLAITVLMISQTFIRAVYARAPILSNIKMHRRRIAELHNSRSQRQFRRTWQFSRGQNERVIENADQSNESTCGFCFLIVVHWKDRHWAGATMKSILIALGLAIAVLSCTSGANSQTMPGRKGEFDNQPAPSPRGQMRVLVPSQVLPSKPRGTSREDLLIYCRREVFRKYGQQAGSQILLPRQFLIAQVDSCVANGGTVN